MKNEEKYLEAKNDYLTKASLCYDTMESLLNNRFDLINPVIKKALLIITTDN